MDKNFENPVYSRDVLELVTVAVQYCAFLENVEGNRRTDFVDTLLKLLPLLYLKGALLPRFDSDPAIELQDVVTEENYDIVRTNVAVVMGCHDDFLDVFVDDMKYSDTPILCTVSESLADIYQDLKNFCMAYKNGVEETQKEAVVQCRDNFETYWGQRLVNVMRALHELRYGVQEDEEDEDFEKV